MCLAVLFVHDALSTSFPSIFIYSLCYTKREGNGEDRKWDREKEISEAGNRTPVVRNTKPLYYFGSVLISKLGYIKTASTTTHKECYRKRPSDASVNGTTTSKWERSERTTDRTLR